MPDYVEQRYVQHIRPQNIKNLGVLLAKALLNGTPPEWLAHRLKVLISLEVVRDRPPTAWDEGPPSAREPNMTACAPSSLKARSISARMRARAPARHPQARGER